MRIFGVNSTGGFSGGGGSYFFKALGRRNEVKSTFIQLSKFDFCGDLVRSFRPYPNPYEKLPWSFFPYHKNIGSFLRRTQICERKIKNLTWKPDMVLQLGVYLSPFSGNSTFPYSCYIDATSKTAEAYPPWGDMYRSKKTKLKWMRLQKDLFSNAFKVFTMSELTRKSVIEDYGIRPEKVATVYSGPNIDKLPSFAKNFGSKNILFVGGDFRRKGGIALLKAFKEVNSKIPGAKLFIVGSNPEISMPGVEIKGFVKKTELESLFMNASVFVMPSLFDPFPHVFLEAMAYKTPCIGGNNFAIPEIIENEKTGFTVSVQDHLKIAERIEYLLQDENTAKFMGEQGRQKIEKLFNWDAVAKRVTQALQD
jgi:glycosyltransferase involved in cell wall biosynthesis